MSFWPMSGDKGWRKIISIALHLFGIGALVLALFASGAYSAGLLQ